MSYSKSSNQNANVKQVASLFEEVQHHHNNKFQIIDQKPIHNEEKYKQKLVIYESYVKDLSIQTRLLLQILDEVEKEANQRVFLLENQLKKANLSLQNHSSSDSIRISATLEREKWILSHENLDLRHDLDLLTSFISVARRTGKWETKRFQLKSLSIDRIIQSNQEEISLPPFPLNKELQYRDERIQLLQSEINQLRENLQPIDENKYKAQNLILSNKVEDLRAKLIEECQKSETLKMEIRLKTSECNDLKETLNQYKKQIEEFSSKLKTISDQHRDSTVSFTKQIQIKQKQIDQFQQNFQEINAEKISLENERRDLQKLCQTKDLFIENLQTQIRQSEKEFSTIIPIEATVSKTKYDQLDEELIQTRKRIETITTELKMKENLIDQHEENLRSLKEIHDQHWHDHLRTTTSTVEQLQTEIRSLKRLLEETNNELEKQSLEFRACQKRLTMEQSRTNVQDHEQQQLRQSIDQSNRQLQEFRLQIQQTMKTNEELEQNIDQLNHQRQIIDKQLMETIALVDLRNQTIIDYKQQIETMEISIHQKQQELIEKQKRIEELEQNMIEQSAEIAKLSETMETDQIKKQHRDKFVEENSTKALNDIQLLQQELQQISQSFVERERANNSLTKQIQQLNDELQLKNDEFQKMQKSFQKQLSKKQDQLIRYDRTLHDEDIRLKYAKEECLIQEKEIQRLNTIQEEQATTIEILQQDLIQLHKEKESISVQYDQCDVDLRTLKVYRDEENRRYKEEISRLNVELTTLKNNEAALIKNVKDLTENLALTSNELEEVQQQNESYQNELENLQKLLYEETESGSKASSTVIILTRQFEDAEKRANVASDQLNDYQLQIETLSIKNETLKSELNQARFLIDEYTNKEIDLKQNLNRINKDLDETKKILIDREREIERLNNLVSHLQFDYEESKNELSLSHDQLVQLQMRNQTIEQHLKDKTDEFNSITNRFHQLEENFHLYEKDHRYSNEEFFQCEQHSKNIENQLKSFINEHRQIQHDNQILNEEILILQQQLEEMKNSDLQKTECLMQSIDQATIYKEKLTLLGDCFSALVRQAAESSEQWSNLTIFFDEQMTILNTDSIQLEKFDQRFEQSTKIIAFIQSQHEEILLRTLAFRAKIEKFRLFMNKFQKNHTKINEENRNLKEKLEEQEKKLNEQIEDRTELQRQFDKIVVERNQLMENLNITKKKIDQLDHHLIEYNEENRLFQQTIDKLENQLTNLHQQNKLLQKTIEENLFSYRENINQSEILLNSLKQTNQSSLHSLEGKNAELQKANEEIKAIKYQIVNSDGKLEKLDKIIEEYQEHISVLERSIDEHKRLIRKREKEIEDLNKQCENLSKGNSIQMSKLTKQEIEIDNLRMEKNSLNDELTIVKENFLQSEKEQKKLKNDCDQVLHLIHRGISDLCHWNDLLTF